MKAFYSSNDLTILSSQPDIFLCALHCRVLSITLCAHPNWMNGWVTRTSRKLCDQLKIKTMLTLTRPSTCMWMKTLTSVWRAYLVVVSVMPIWSGFSIVPPGETRWDQTRLAWNMADIFFNCLYTECFQEALIGIWFYIPQLWRTNVSCWDLKFIFIKANAQRHFLFIVTLLDLLTPLCHSNTGSATFIAVGVTTQHFHPIPGMGMTGHIKDFLKENLQQLVLIWLKYHILVSSSD